MKKLLILALVVGLIGMAVVGTAIASQGDTLSGGVWAKHGNGMGPPGMEFAACHNGIKADEPGVLKGKYAHMGGPNKECADCHDGAKAPLLPLPPGSTSCADCHHD